MKSLVVIMAVGLIALAALFFVSKASSDRELAATRANLDSRTRELESARAEVAQVKVEMEANFTRLQDQVTTLAAEKNVAEEKINALSDDMRAILGDLQAEKVSRRTIEQRNVELTASLHGATSELELLREQHTELAGNHAALQGAHEKTLEQFGAMREDYVSLTRERDELIAKFNDLSALRDQIRVVKVELRTEHIEDWKRRDRAVGVGGNAGFLMRGGQWQTGRAATDEGAGRKFPLVEDIHRDQ